MNLNCNTGKSALSSQIYCGGLQCIPNERVMEIFLLTTLFSSYNVYISLSHGVLIRYVTDMTSCRMKNSFLFFEKSQYKDFETVYNDISFLRAELVLALVLCRITTTCYQKFPRALSFKSR